MDAYSFNFKPIQSLDHVCSGHNVNSLFKCLHCLDCGHTVDTLLIQWWHLNCRFSVHTVYTLDTVLITMWILCLHSHWGQTVDTLSTLLVYASQTVETVLDSSQCFYFVPNDVVHGFLLTLRKIIVHSKKMALCTDFNVDTVLTHCKYSLCSRCWYSL